MRVADIPLMDRGDSVRISPHCQIAWVLQTPLQVVHCDRTPPSVASLVEDISTNSPRHNQHATQIGARFSIIRSLVITTSLTSSPFPALPSFLGSLKTL
jgi:hypothetical protein